MAGEVRGQPRLYLYFHGNLRPLLPPRWRQEKEVAYSLCRRASIKDIIESLRVPHPEVGRLLINGREAGFSHIPLGGERVDIFPLTPEPSVTRPSLLRPKPLPRVAFLVDINVGKLATLLRMAGLDSLYEPRLQGRKLAVLAAHSQRILLSRDRQILQYAEVSHGHLVRAQDPLLQLAEIITLYQLQQDLVPFSRCLRCNTLLADVEKQAILHRLEPLTRKYFHIFKQCPGCGRIYWKGSHQQAMEKTIQQAMELAAS